MIQCEKDNSCGSTLLPVVSQHNFDSIQDEKVVLQGMYFTTFELVDGRGQHERQRTSGIGCFWIGKTWYGYRSWTGTFIEAPPAPPMQDTRAETQLLPGDAGLPEEHGLSANR